MMTENKLLIGSLQPGKKVENIDKLTTELSPLQRSYPFVALLSSAAPLAYWPYWLIMSFVVAGLTGRPSALLDANHIAEIIMMFGLLMLTMAPPILGFILGLKVMLRHTQFNVVQRIMACIAMALSIMLVSYTVVIVFYFGF